MVAARAICITARAARAPWAYLGCGPPFFRRARLCRGRYAGPAGEPGSRTSSAGLRDGVPRPARRQGRAALPPYFARIRDEKAAGRGLAADLATRSCLSQRRAEGGPPSRIFAVS